MEENRRGRNEADIPELADTIKVPKAPSKKPVRTARWMQPEGIPFFFDSSIHWDVDRAFRDECESSAAVRARIGDSRIEVQLKWIPIEQSPASYEFSSRGPNYPYTEGLFCGHATYYKETRDMNKHGYLLSRVLEFSCPAAQKSYVLTICSAAGSTSTAVSTLKQVLSSVCCHTGTRPRVTTAQALKLLKEAEELQRTSEYLKAIEKAEAARDAFYSNLAPQMACQAVYDIIGWAAEVCDWDRAERHCYEYLRSPCDSWHKRNVYTQLGDIALHRLDYVSAEKWLRSAFEPEKDIGAPYPYSRFKLAIAYRGLGVLQDAKALLENWLLIFPEDIKSDPSYRGMHAHALKMLAEITEELADK